MNDDKPILDVYLERHGNEYCKVGVASMQGYRKEMEDTHTIDLPLPNCMGVFGVFDGHGGSNAAVYCRDHFAQHIREIQSLTVPEIEDAVMRLDEQFIQREENKSDAGCTATFALVKVERSGSNTVAIGNVGDSRSLLIRSNGEFTFSTKDHKPDDQKEKRRIIQAKGVVFQHRVCGCLAVSRAIGDKEFKENDSLPQEEQLVIAVPDVSFFTAEAGDMLILCCDGIFECMSNETLVKYIIEGMKKSEDIAIVLRDLLMKCVEQSNDNMTAMIIHFTNGENYNKPSEFVPGQYFQGDEEEK